MSSILMENFLGENNSKRKLTPNTIYGVSQYCPRSHSQIYQNYGKRLCNPQGTLYRFMNDSFIWFFERTVYFTLFQVDLGILIRRHPIQEWISADTGMVVH